VRATSMPSPRIVPLGAPGAAFAPGDFDSDSRLVARITDAHFFSVTPADRTSKLLSSYDPQQHGGCPRFAV
jgi:hypothetical protein